MNYLLPCVACDRHIRANETYCPFCSHRSKPGSAPPPPLILDVRLSRAALFAFTALFGTSFAVACSSSSGGLYGGPPTHNPPIDGSANPDAPDDAGDAD
jgi:hypothetical protein